MQRKRERGDATLVATAERETPLLRVGGDDPIEHEMKRLRLARVEDEHRGRAPDGKRWPHGDDDDVDMDADVSSPRVDYRPINLTLRECHYLRQLRKFQAERVSYLERRAPTDAAAAAVIHAMLGRRR